MQSKPPSPSVRSWGKPAILGAVLFLIPVLVFIPAMSGAFIWDDDITLMNNPLVKLPLLEGLKYIWFSIEATDYYPVTWTTFWIEWRIFGENPAGYHVVNILLHAASTVLLWKILLRLNLPGGPATAWCAALLFAIHPVCVDSVAWISQRKNTLSMVFYLAAILSYLRYDDGGGRKIYWTAVGAFLLALLSKSSIITLPLVLACLLWYRHGDAFLKKCFSGIWKDANAFLSGKNRKALKNPLVQLFPFFVLAAAAAFMTIWFQGKVLGYGLDSGDSATGTIMSALEGSVTGDHNKRDLGRRILVSGQVYWFYILKILFPARVAMVYQTWVVNPHHFSHYLPTLGMLGALGVTFFFRKKIGRGACAGLTYIAVALLPVLGFVAMSYQNYSWVANHLCYIAVPGVAVLATGAAAWFFSRLGKASRIAAPCTVAIVAGIFAVQSWNRCGLFQDSERLWRDNISKQPGAHAGWNELGIALIHKGRLEEAADAFRECINLNFRFVKPHNNLGTVLAYLERYEEAAEAFKRALWVNQYDPDALGNLGLIYLELGQPEKAIETFEKTLRLRIMSPATYHNLGLAYAELNRMDEATASFERAIQMDPTNRLFHGVLGRHYLSAGNDSEALRHLLISIELGTPDPNYHNSAAWILSTSTNPSLRDGNRALQIVTQVESSLEKPDIALLRTKAAALAELGRFDEAIAVLAGVRELAEKQGATAILEHVDSAIALYRAGQPYRSIPQAPVAP